ncbi:MAG TPA: serine/threonine protein kinase, partial [Nannocystis exedens]|nr:serine/threonine protein kinase [Nannocystis exedens]
FRNEATAAGTIGNPHICDILDFGQSELGPFIVMELMKGRPLNDLFESSGRIDPGLAVLIVRQALEGLEAAHRAGIIHRDLKPENIFLSEPAPGRLLVKLVDFGISKFSQAESSSGRTGVGVLMGTPEYMSPEQSEGAANVDERTDIWAMGLILYRALSGTDAFGGPTIASTLVAVATREPVPLTELAPYVPAELVAVIEKCIQKDPARRYSSARELSDALAPFENLPPIPADAMRSAPSQPLPVAPIGGSLATDYTHTQTPTTSPAAQAAQAGTSALSSDPATAVLDNSPPLAGPPPPAGPPLAGPPLPASPPPPGFHTRSEPSVGPVANSGAATWSTELPPAAPDNNWSMGQAAALADEHGEHRKEEKSGGKTLYIIVLLLILAAIVAGLYYAFGPGSGDVETAPEDPGIVADSAAPENASTTGTTGTTGTATTTTGPAATTGSGTSAEPGTGTGTTGTDTGTDTGTKSKKPKVNPDKSLVVSAGGIYTLKTAAHNTDLAGAKSYCASLKKKRFARLRTWKLASSKEVLKFASKSEVDKFLYWTRDKADKENFGTTVVMLKKHTTERPANDKRARPFCVARR